MINKNKPFGKNETSNGGQPLENNKIEFGEDSSFLLPRALIKASYPQKTNRELEDKWEQLQIAIEKFPENTADILGKIDSDRLENSLKYPTHYEKYGTHDSTIVGVGRVSDLTFKGSPCLN